MARTRHIFAIDPGEVHCGFAWYTIYHRPVIHEHTNADALHHCVDSSSDGILHLTRCVTFSPPMDLIEYLETNIRYASVIVVERFQLYPWMARQQGFSTFGTAETIGMIKYLAGRYDIPVRLQDAARNLKEGRGRAADWGFDMVERKLGSGRFVYRGPDFNLPGQPHRRDAASHGAQYCGSSGAYEPT